MLHLLHKQQGNTKPFLFNFFFAAAAAKGAMYYAAMAMVIFPRVKISCFRAKLTWYFMCIYVIKNCTLSFSSLKQRDFFLPAHE